MAADQFGGNAGVAVIDQTLHRQPVGGIGYGGTIADAHLVRPEVGHVDGKAGNGIRRPELLGIDQVVHQLRGLLRRGDAGKERDEGSGAMDGRKFALRKIGVEEEIALVVPKQLLNFFSYLPCPLAMAFGSLGIAQLQRHPPQAFEPGNEVAAGVHPRVCLPLEPTGTPVPIIQPPSRQAMGVQGRKSL